MLDRDYLPDLIRPECEDCSQHSITLTRLSRVERFLPVLTGHLVNIFYVIVASMYYENRISWHLLQIMHLNVFVSFVIVTVVNAWQLPCNRETPRFAAIGHWLTPGLIREMNLFQKLHWK